MKNLILTLAIIALVVIGIGLWLESGEQSTDEDQQGVDTTNWSTFTSDEYDFSLQYPADDWNTEIAATNQIAPRFNFYLRPAGASVDLPLDHFANVSNVTVFPEGMPTEGFFGQTEDTISIQTAIETNEESRVYVLDDGTPFAAFIKPADPPQSWTENGFIWMRLAVDDLETRCERDGEVISQQECDPLAAGDDIFHSGEVDAATWATQQAIVESITFAEGSTTGDLIELQNPQSNEVIQSPLTIEGQARGPWYFEASFSAVLTDWDGRIIAEGPIQALGPWMTEDFVDFRGTLEFESPFPEGGADFQKRGSLILQKANPSGLPENADALEIPVRFAE